jgi:hypothetical protein
MNSRIDLITARRVDLVLILLPIIGRWEAACSLAADGVPIEVAARVLALPKERRHLRPAKSVAAPLEDY